MAIQTLASTLPPELERERVVIEQHARDAGLDFFDVIFEMCDWNQVNAIAAFGGFPVRYPHWRFGMEYESLRKSYSYGLSKIYEMVINTDPCYAYLLESNHLTDQKLVMAHVYGHSDFFKNNFFYAHTNRKMVDQMANHATRVQRHINIHGLEAVEDFIDVCLSLEDLIDPHSPYIKRGTSSPEAPEPTTKEDDDRVGKFASKDYMEAYINPRERVAEERQRRAEEHERSQSHYPVTPQRDVLAFLIDHAPIKAWKRDILEIIRDEAYYFFPQGQTKIMNEGWASFWHSKLMTTKILTDAEVIHYADHHSGTVATQPGQLNPYKVGIELFRHIKERWDKGRFGLDYQEADWKERERWDTGAGQGMKKIFEVRRACNDVTFIDNYLTPEFCMEQNLFVYEFNPRTDSFEIDTREFDMVKQKLLFQLTNHGRPVLEVVNANHENRGELLLAHRYQGLDLDMEKGRYAMENLWKIWTRPVHIHTIEEHREVLHTYNGKKFTTKRLQPMV